MYMQDYNNENVVTLGKELSVLGLPGFKGVMKHSRIEGKPPQLIIRVEDLTPIQETVLIDVINAHPAKEAARIADYELNEAYKDKRRAAYPPIGDQLDAVLKGFESLQSNGEVLPSELVGLLMDWNDVKVLYPKP